ncbi:outer membrane beta-barrel protein [Hyunsoonleella aestuarii]|uniref:Outer membrane protein beta-barrel domain-containing protein n=1 Tax=Hyunsoonleella aestuarii TaxID=912802 RepID=A0ABP8E9B7_9FLAO|nr:outer membrane beta-barrel protein [Hyunsoonleella aestuarii]
MSEKKHIDRLFQEKFKDFEVNPSDKVWGNIEAKLKEKKKKRRIIPIWWRYAGVAALLLLLLTVGINYFNSPDNESNIPENRVVEQKPENAEENNLDVNTTNTSSEKEVIKITSAPNSNGIIADEKNTEQETDVVNNQNNSGESSSNIIKKESKTAITKSVETSEDNAQINKGKLKETINKRTDAIAKSAENIDNTQDNPIDSKLNNIPSDIASIDISKTDEILNNIKNETNTAVAAEEKVDSNASQDVSKENTELNIEDALEKTKDIIEEEKLNRWSVAPNAAPVFFNSLGEGSSIDPQFNSNSKSGELNMSYGIRGSYAVNKRLTIRSGINRVTLGYNTNDVVAFQSISSNPSAAALQNISADQNISTTSNVSLVSAQNISAKSSSGSTLLSTTGNTSINQEFGYIEIPLEIQYAISTKKLGVNLIGGFSSFFLNENKIYSESNGSKTLIGEATNLNKTSYSANLGLGINYEISKKLDLNLEPIFKYQINAFSNTSGDFTPYFIGVYTGIAIKF